MQSVSVKIWTRVAVSISYDDNHYTTGTSVFITPPPSEWGKSLGDGPLRLEELSSSEAHLAEPPRGKTAYQMRPSNWRVKEM